MKKFIIIMYVFLSVNALGYSLWKIGSDINILLSHGNIPRIQKITIDGKRYDLDWGRLLMLTAGMESGFGRDNYEGRVAKTFMQIEEDSFNHYMKALSGTRDKVSEFANVSELKDENAIAIAYVFYLSKMFVHTAWIDKHKHIFYKSNKDVEFFIYKLYFNSIKGKSTYEKWKYRENWLKNNMELLEVI